MWKTRARFKHGISYRLKKIYLIFGNDCDKTHNYYNQARRTKCRPIDDIDNDKCIHNILRNTLQCAAKSIGVYHLY